MKKALSLMVLGALFAGSVACTSAPQKEEAPQAAIEPVAAESIQPAQETQKAPELSLGASSSGRGH